MTENENPELEHIGTQVHERLEAFVQGEQIHDPEQDQVFDPHDYKVALEYGAGPEWDNWNARTEAGELRNPRLEMREYQPPTAEDLEFTTKVSEVTRDNAKTAEEMAKQLGVTVEELPDALHRQIELYSRASQRMLQAFVPPKMNRAQRRARDKAMRRRRV